MPRFLVHTQQGGGCDYTIGCGHRINIIVADDLQDARERVRQEWFGLVPPTPSSEEDDEEFDGRYAIHQGRGIKNVTLYEIGAVEALDVAGLFGEVNARKDARERAAKEIRDRAQYEAMKTQFEPKS